MIKDTSGSRVLLRGVGTHTMTTSASAVAAKSVVAVSFRVSSQTRRFKSGHILNVGSACIDGLDF